MNQKSLEESLKHHPKSLIVSIFFQNKKSPWNDGSEYPSIQEDLQRLYYFSEDLYKLTG